MKSTGKPRKLAELQEAMLWPLPEDSEDEQAQAWEEVDAGRYMPRRIRGSCRGRTLG
jgi:hypothetical protein